MPVTKITNEKYYDKSLSEECYIVVKEEHYEIVYPNLDNFRKYTNKTYIQTNLVPMAELDNIADTLFED